LWGLTHAEFDNHKALDPPMPPPEVWPSPAQALDAPRFPVRPQTEFSLDWARSP